MLQKSKENSVFVELFPKIYKRNLRRIRSSFPFLGKYSIIKMDETPKKIQFPTT